ncbi:citrate transporter-like domain-containing protein [Glomus cerebriforme]|uniref:Citrate transporter-like domain-containing protein n=1 Tax=Glomus cerebriforme TaxID=658196 RepID=A0A397TIZ2_9GLOM|nr:citrate transporter-like domain-containing protein [Glomus cerebriforme]
MLRLNESHYEWQNKKSYLAIVIFIITWLLLIKRWSAIKVSHCIVAILGCSLMVLFDIISKEETFNSICGETLLLVAAFMVIHIKLEQGGFVEFLNRALLYGKPTPLWLLVRVSFLSGALAALIMDNGAVTILSPLVFRLCDENHLEIEPFMLALATSANIGSIATVIGNVINMIITESSSEISFLEFFIHMTPIAIIGLLLNTIFLVFYYRKKFIGQTVKSYKPPKSTTISSTSTTNLSPRNAALTTTPPQVTIEPTYDTDEDAIVAGMISDSDGRDESDTESNDDESHQSEGENSSLLARRKRLHSKPQYANEFSSSPDRFPPKRNYAFEQVVYMNDNDNDSDSTSPWVIRRDNHNWNPRQNQSALTRFAWDAPNESRGLHGLGSNIQKQTEQFITDTKNFLGNGDFLKNVFLILMMFGMYIALFFEKSLGWTAVAVAALLLFFDGKNVTNVINKINWGLIIYLIGIFGVMKGLLTTQIPDLLWDHYEEVFINPDIKNLPMSIFALSIMIILLVLSLTSVPATLLILSYIPKIMDERLKNNVGYLLAWNVILVGNLSARKSSAGLIVSEIVKDHLFDTPLIQPHEFSVWGKYSVWSTVIISIIGTFIISFFH